MRLTAFAGYTTALRSLIQGRAMASVVLHGYEEARVARGFKVSRKR